MAQSASLDRLPNKPRRDNAYQPPCFDVFQYLQPLSRDRRAPPLVVVHALIVGHKMNIDQSNVLKIASIGAAVWWIVFGLPALNDIFSANPSDKQFILATAMLFGSFCGAAFYICLMPSMVKAVRSNFRPHPARTSLMAAWSILPLPPILFAGAMVFMKIFSIGNA